MLRYKIDVLKELKNNGYSTYRLRNDKLMGEAQIQKIRFRRDSQQGKFEYHM